MSRTPSRHTAPELRQQLLRAHRQLPTRRPLWHHVAAVAVAAAVVSTAPVVVSHTLDRPDAAIATTDDAVTVTLRGEVDPGDVQTRARREGAEITVAEVPVAPHQAGTWVGVAGDVEQVTVDRYRAHVPRSAGPVTLRLGRAADPGERYAVTASAFSPGGPLHCEDLRRDDLDALEQAIPDGYEVLWQPVGADVEQPTTTARPSAAVSFVEVTALSDNEVLVLWTDTEDATTTGC